MIKVNVVLQFEAEFMRCLCMLLAMFIYLFNLHYDIRVRIMPCLIKQMI